MSTGGPSGSPCLRDDRLTNNRKDEMKLKTQFPSNFHTHSRPYTTRAEFLRYRNKLKPGKQTTDLGTRLSTAIGQDKYLCEPICCSDQLLTVTIAMTKPLRHCLIWDGAYQGHQPVFGPLGLIRKGKGVRRFAYELKWGQLPDHCPLAPCPQGHMACVNVDHLFPNFATRADRIPKTWTSQADLWQQAIDTTNKRRQKK